MNKDGRFPGELPRREFLKLCVTATAMMGLPLRMHSQSRCRRSNQCQAAGHLAAFPGMHWLFRISPPLQPSHPSHRSSST